MANNKYDLKNIGLASRTRLDEGKLYVYVIKHKNVVGILVLSVRLLLGKIRRQDFDYYIADNFEIQSSKTIHHVAIDGESIKLKSPLKYKSLPKSIRVIV